ncbi:conserved hypothetical protein [Aspergillus terreus NIH2624]|uniref:Pre-rRNA processing protein n=1 Tax=Aspergillus terreus (strain NIH 2624 / FGSC A1156) TaxID=341663 RepID=Q0CLE3_ASPTN|nr:uncharacterized protein ATEG_05491 [Aspergillus terreus NIH2624]EAU34560.1 conserved hypothetical protein [Aspergillus terreus NIH2624]
MADEARTPLLSEDDSTSSRRRSSSTDKHASTESTQLPPPFELSNESTPLLHRRDDDLAAYGGTQHPRRRSSVSQVSSIGESFTKQRGRVRWPLFCVALALLAVLAILLFAFVAPAMVEEYVKEAAIFRPTNVSIESATSNGIRTRVQGDFTLDAKRVHKRSAQALGRFATWIGREVETGDSETRVYLPEYGNVLVGSASLPSMKLDIRNSHVNHLDFTADVIAGDIPGIRAVAMDWLEGRLGHLRIKGAATLHLKSGILSLGEQTLSDSVTLEASDFPSIPDVKIAKFNVHDADTPGKKGGLAVDASVSAQVDSPFTLTVPPLGFEILVPNCSPDDPYISIAEVTTKDFPVNPGQATFIDISGFIRGISDELTKTCPGKKKSPLDFLVKSYIQGLRTTVYVRGAEVPSLNTPDWVTDILKSVTVPLPFTGHALDDLVRNFTMTDVHFSLPDPIADPESPESQPRVSALVKVLVGLPKHVNLHIDVPRVRALADVFYHEKKLGVLKLPKWVPANSTLLDDVDGAPALFVDFAMKDAPLDVTDEDVLTEILQTLLFEGKSVELSISANVDAEVATGLGKFAIRGIPGEGVISVKPPYGRFLDHFGAQVESLKLGASTASSLTIETTLNVTNPTEYSATVPFVDLRMLYNATRVAHVTARNLSIVPGVNSGLSVDLQWSPFDLDGQDGANAGRELVSQYISGANTSVTIQTYEGTFPALPKIGQALSRLGLEIQIPRVPVPGNPNNGKDQGFIQDATLHLWSSTAEFTLSSPFPNTTMEITSVEANASYQEHEEVGKIHYYQPFQVPPGLSRTPRLPVELNMTGVGYDAVKKALGGSLELDATARVGVQIQHYSDTILYRGKGIDSRVQL